MEKLKSWDVQELLPTTMKDYSGGIAGTAALIGLSITAVGFIVTMISAVSSKKKGTRPSQ